MTLMTYLLDWRASRNRFANLKEYTYAATTHLKRPLETSSTSPTQRKFNAYTEDDELAMATYIFGRLPK
jgi:hypothetical protein